MRERGGFSARLEQRFRPFGNLAQVDEPGWIPIASLVAGAVASINISAIGWFLLAQNEPVSGWIALGIGISALLGTIVFVRTGSVVFLLVASTWLGMVGTLAIHVALGGYSWSGGFLAWGLAQVALIALVSRWQIAAIAVGYYLIAAVVTAILEPSIRELRGGPPESIVPTVLGSDLVVANIFFLAGLIGILVAELNREQARTMDVLFNVFPIPIARRLKKSENTIADRFDHCSVLFADIVGFTAHSTSISPDRLVDQLNRVFSVFDAAAADHGVEKIKTVGDGYLAIAGAPIPVTDHARRVCDMAVEMRQRMTEVTDVVGVNLGLRIGIASGPVVAGVIGQSRFAYDLWGETVNTASRLEGAAQPGQILVCGRTAELVKGSHEVSSLGERDLKGLGPLEVLALVSTERS